MIENLFGLIAFITSFIGLAPQIYKTMKTKSADDLSMLMLINYFICSISWIVYGVFTNAGYVISSNIAGLLFSIMAIAQKKYYDAVRRQ